MEEEEIRFLRRKVRSCNVDVHPTEKSLIVNYEVEASIVCENEQVVLADRSQCQKIIRLRNLTSDVDSSSVANEVIGKCRLISPSKQSHVEHLINYLQNRHDNTSNGFNRQSDETKVHNTSTNSREKGNLLKLEDYVELLYEDTFEKIKGSALILDVAKEAVNLHELSGNESFLMALSRVLREDWKKSLDLSINIVSVFLCFSAYTTFHTVICWYKIGSLCMEMLQYETERYRETKTEMEQLSFGNATSSIAKNITSIPHSKLPVPKSLSATKRKSRSQIPVKGGLRSATPTSLPNTRMRSISRPRPETAHLSVVDSKNLLSNNVVESPYELKKRTLEKLIYKRNQLLRVCFNLLLNISENEKVQDKIRKRNVIELLMSVLPDCSCDELKILIISFLQKLSVYRENKDQMVNLKIIERLPKFQGLEMIKLDEVLLRLLFNLSFDSKIQEKIAKSGFISDLVIKLEVYDSSNKRCACGILYNLSTNDFIKSLFAGTGFIVFANNAILAENSEIAHLLAAIHLNLSSNKKCAIEMATDQFFICSLMEQTFERVDVLLLKIAHNLSLHKPLKHLFVQHSKSLMNSIVIRSSQNNKVDFMLECLATLGNMPVSDVDFFQFLQNENILKFIDRCFTSEEEVSDDLVLEVIKMLGTAVYDENCAEWLLEHQMLDMLINLLKEKQEDDEMVLQIIYVFYQALQHPFIRDYLVKDTDAPAYFIDLLHDNNASIRKVCHLCLETIKEFDESWTDRVKFEKFQWHNSNWLEMIQNQILDRTSSIGDNLNDDFIPAYNLLQNSSIFRFDGSGSGSLSYADGNLDTTPSSSTSYHSAGDSSTCIDSDHEQFDLKMQNRDKHPHTVFQDVLKNLVITNDIDDVE